MKRNKTKVTAFLSAAFIVAFGLILSCCRQEKTRTDELLAEKFGRQEARYTEQKGEGGLKKTTLSLDTTLISKPSGPGSFIRLEHLPPVEQGNTGTCWAHAAMSLLESELKRQGHTPVKLSEMYIVYWEYLEKARRFIREKGASFLGQGSEAGLALARAAQYGLVRESDYNGLKPGQSGHDHSQLFREFSSFLESLKKSDDWDETRGLARIKDILSRHLGPPPGRIEFEGSSITPLEYMHEILKLNPDDYVSFMSFMYVPFYSRGEFKVPDNWPHDPGYFNLPLHEFGLTLLRALRRGYTAVLSIDFSEPGYVPENDLAIVPSFDIPRNFIDQSSRELRFANNTTTDDHAVHCVGYTDTAGENWFLVKDSWENAWYGKHPGLFFYRDDYIKLKCLMFTVHKSGAPEILAKFGPGE